MNHPKYDISSDMHYLQLLAKSFPNVAAASNEIINLSAILNLPKGTEHFLADIHGEHEAFLHVLKNASGRISKKVDEIFGEYMPTSAKKELCTLIYYPEQKLELVKSQLEDHDKRAEWYRMTLNQLVMVFREISSKYTRSRVRKSLPPEYSYILEELLHERAEEKNKAGYVSENIGVRWHYSMRKTLPSSPAAKTPIAKRGSAWYNGAGEPMGKGKNA